MIRLELKNGEIAEINLLERSIIYYRQTGAVETASKRPDTPDAARDDTIERLSADAKHFRALARDAIAEREAWAQNAKAATGGKVENPRQIDAYIDGLKEKLCDIANIVRDYVPPVRPNTKGAK